eukprot:299931_1
MLQRFVRTSRVLPRACNPAQLAKLSLRFAPTTNAAKTPSEWANKLADCLKVERSASDVTETLYNDWATEYDECLAQWGYIVPTIMANLLKANLEYYDEKQLKILDLGCGTGLVGKEIREKHDDIDAVIYGSDLCSGQFDMAKEKK